MSTKRIAFAALAVMAALSMSACAKERLKAGTITVWDYYGKDVSPLLPLVESFEREYPGVKVDRQDLDWETMHTKLNVALSSGKVPDVVTIDMTWLPALASNEAFADIAPLSGGKLNGIAFDRAWAPLAVQAMKQGDKFVAALYDFDAYALYYRSDLFDAKGLKAPATWEDIVAVGKAIGQKDNYKYCVYADSFHAAQFVYENGGRLMSPDLKSTTFSSKESVDAIRFLSDLTLKHKIGVNWLPDSGDPLQGAVDGRIALWSDGPYRMAQLKSASPEMAGKWRVAPHPGNKNAGSYLGGTGLCIPRRSANAAAAWKFIEFALRPENAKLVYTKAGAAPALLAALDSPEVNAPDPYFGGQRPMEVFKLAMETAIAFPRIKQWDDIDTAFTEAFTKVLTRTKGVEEAMREADESSAKILAQ
jgi:ABC-type glycerol-3-phosphate transport system substrate-binding protein